MPVLTPFTVTPLGAILGILLGAMLAAGVFAWLLHGALRPRCNCPVYPLETQDRVGIVYKIHHRPGCDAAALEDRT